MKISQLYVYPIKSLRGQKLPAAEATYKGFKYDRTFMLLQATGPGIIMKNMQVAHIPEMALFLTQITYPTDANPRGGEIIVTYQAPGREKSRQLKIPLQPNVENLDTLDVDIYGSRTKAYDMGKSYNEWFTTTFNFQSPIVLAYLGDNRREVLGNVSPTVSGSQMAARASGGSWISSLAANIPFINKLPGVDDGLTFTEVAPYLIITERSWQNVNDRLGGDEAFDITKFRPNIVVEGSEEDFEEDYWAEVTVGTAQLKMILTQNCARCTSLNVDFATGKFGTGKAGSMLKILQKDRRVDPGAKYSPIFGRYGFLDRGTQGSIIRVGDEIAVMKRNQERTKFEWPGLST